MASTVITNPQGTMQNVANDSDVEVARVYSFSLTLAANVTQEIDLRSVQNQNVIKNIQGIYIDNSANTVACQVTTSTGQVITVGPYYQLAIPIYISPLAPVLSFLGVGKVNITLNNFRTDAAAWTTNPLYTQSVKINSPSYTGSAGNSTRVQSVSGTNGTVIHSSNALIVGYQIGNSGTTDAWIKFYNSSTVPTAGSGTPVFDVYLPAKTVQSFSVDWGLSTAFTSGLAYTITGGATDTDTTAVAADQITGLILW